MTRQLSSAELRVLRGVVDHHLPSLARLNPILRGLYECGLVRPCKHPRKGGGFFVATAAGRKVIAHHPAEENAPSASVAWNDVLTMESSAESP